MSCVVIVLRHVLEVVACTAPRFWHRKCRYPRIRGFMPIPQVPQFPMYGFICISVGPKYIPTYHPHTSDPQGPSQPRMYTPNPECPLSGKCDRGSQHPQRGIHPFPGWVDGFTWELHTRSTSKHQQQKGPNIYRAPAPYPAYVHVPTCSNFIFLNSSRAPHSASKPPA